MTLRLNGSTSGYTEIDAPAVAGSNTLTLPTGAGSANQLLKNGSTAGSLAFGTATEDGSGNFAFNSGYGSSAVAYGCRAWVNFNGTGTVAIRASGNVSSITDNGTGDYTVNFTTAMVDANCTPVITTHRGDGAGANPGYNSIYATAANAYTSITSSSVRVSTTNSATVSLDMPYVGVAIFR